MTELRTRPAISVIVTVYDRFEYLPEALESVRAQTFAGGFETIVIDDGSRESVRDRYSKRFPEVRWLRQENRGLCAARQFGSEAAEGRYLVYLDDDDLWEPERLETQYRFLESNPEADLVYCDMVGFTPRSVARYGYYSGALALMLSAEHREVHEGYLFEPGSLLSFGLAHDPLAAVTVMVRTPFLESMGGWNPDVWMPADCHDFFLRAGFQGHIGFQNRPLVRYRRGHEHITKGLVGPRFEESRVLCDASTRYPAALRDAIRPGLLHYLARVGLLCARSRRFGLTLRCLRQSFAVDPRPTVVLRSWGKTAFSAFYRIISRLFEKAEFL